eukprot:11184051-Lingulodinium_polyedra.AAC.1
MRRGARTGGPPPLLDPPFAPGLHHPGARRGQPWRIKEHARGASEELAGRLARRLAASEQRALAPCPG